MNKSVHSILSWIVLCFLGISASAQGTITGKVLDKSNGAPLVGASCLLEGTTSGALTDLEGNFMIKANAGTYTLIISYIGYIEQRITVNCEGGGTQDLGTINVESDVIGLEEVNILASTAVDRKTPVAVTTIKGDVVEALVGNQEFPEILRKSPSIYVTKEGGGFGDARINVRGFDQRNTAVMINGIPVNDMENGWVYWSNWAGLSDVTSSIQVQRGLGASKLAVASVGGSINIVTNAAEMKKGGSVGVSVGNDGYQKYSLVLSTGLGKKGWAFTLQGTHTRGDGYVDGTQFRAYSYFASLSKTFNDKHSISITGLGAPQWHHQRLTASRFDNVNLQTFRDQGIKFNHYWGMLDGEEFSWRKNFYHKPKFFVNHYWNISDKTSLKTSAYASYGRGGGTGPRGRINSPNGLIFDSFGGFGTGTHDANGQVRFDDLVRWQMGGVEDATWGTKEAETEGPFAGQTVTTSSGNGFIRRASMNYHDWYGVLSNLNTKLSDNLELTAGIDYRYYIGEHYRRLENLLGLDAYQSRADVNNPANFITEESPADFGNFGDNSYKDGNNVLNYWNDGLVQWLGLFAQLEYSTDRWTIFGAVSGSNQGFKREDYFIYEDSDPIRVSDWENFMGGTVKAGANFNIDANHNVFVNGGFFSRQPIFDNVFINFSNTVNPDIENQKVYAFEAGYGYRSSWLNLNLNLYSTLWTDRQFDRGVTIDVDGVQQDGLAIFRGVGQIHQGVELDFVLSPAPKLEIDGMLSLGNWVYTENFEADVTNTDTQQKIGTATIFADGLKVGDAAQTTFSLGARYEIVRGLRAYASYYFADNLYAAYDIDDAQFLNPGGVIAQLPSYSLVDAGLSYFFKVGGLDMTLRFNMNNVLDEQYVAEMDTNILDDPSTPENEFYQNRGFFGFGRTWNAGLKVRF